MKKAVTIISILCGLIIIAGILIFTGVIDIGKILGNKNSKLISDEQTDTSGQTGAVNAALWIDYMDTCVLVDKNGTVVGTSSEKPENMMQLSGVNITRMVRGEPVEIDDREAFDYGLEVTVKLSAVGIPDKGEVFISSDHSAIVYLNNIKILLGKNDDLLEKLEDLRKFYNDVIVLEGTLDMQEVSKNKMGYTFRTDGGAGETEIMEETETEGESSEEAENEPDADTEEEYEYDPDEEN